MFDVAPEHEMRLRIDIPNPVSRLGVAKNK